MTPWLTIAGMGEDGFGALSLAAKQALIEAEVVIGARRLLAMLPQLRAELQEWPQPFAVAVERILPLKGRRTVLLATGDPSNYGVARKLLELVPIAEVTIIPHLSAFALAAARLGWSLPDCDTLSLHGRPAALIEPAIQPGARLIVLTADASTIAEVAHRLMARGFADSRITVLENIGGQREQITRHLASNVPLGGFSDLNTIAIECRAGAEAQVYARVPGLPDSAFVHDGQLTKREVRAATLAALMPAPDALLWDVGAGCGSIAIEWSRSTRGAAAVAIERSEARRAMIADNMDRLGAPRLNLIAGEAPDALDGLADPDAIFIGGGICDGGVFEACWTALKPGGRLVVNTVTLEGEARVIDLQETFGGEIVRIQVSHMKRIGSLRALEPRMAVTQWRTVKPW